MVVVVVVIIIITIIIIIITAALWCSFMADYLEPSVQQTPQILDLYCLALKQDRSKGNADKTGFSSP